MTLPLLLRVWDKNLGRLGVIDDPSLATINLRRNTAQDAQITLPSTHPKYDLLRGEGTRLTVDMEGEQILCGYFKLWQAKRATSGNLVISIADDWWIMRKILCWPVPTLGSDTDGAIPSQASRKFHTVTGPAETVFKTLLTANADRLGIPVTVAPDQGRGDTIKVQARMQPLEDYLIPALSDSGLTVTIRQGSTGLVVDVREPVVFPVPLTPDAGIIADWDWEQEAPSVTRTVAGGSGDGTDRLYAQSVDTAAEDTWGPLSVRETFADESDAENITDLTARAKATRQEGRRATRLKLVLQQTTVFAVGQNLRVGDTVTEQLTSSTPRQVPLDSVAISWSGEQSASSGGFRVTPAVGDLDSVGGVPRRYARELAKQSKINRFKGAVR